MSMAGWDKPENLRTVKSETRRSRKAGGRQTKNSSHRLYPTTTFPLSSSLTDFRTSSISGALCRWWGRSPVSDDL